MRPFASWFASIYFAVVALYSLGFLVMSDPYCLPLYVQAGFALASGIGLFMMKRWALWLSAITIPVIVAVELSALSFSIHIAGFSPGMLGLVLNLSYSLIVILAIIVALFLIDKRREFK
jgi:hypothetical protein